MDIKKAREILNIPIDTDIGLVELFKICDAMWLYNGSGPHAQLSNKELHSDGYFNVNEVTKYPNLCQILAFDLSEKLDKYEIEVDAIVSSSYAAIPIGLALAKEMNSTFVFTEKNGEDQVFPGRFEIPMKARMLHVEELITSMKTTESVHNAILNAQFLGIIPNNCEFVMHNGKPIVATIIHRPSQLPTNYPNFEVVSLHEQEVKNWNRAKCPLCGKGSKALKPKSNWKEFMKEQK